MQEAQVSGRVLGIEEPLLLIGDVIDLLIGDAIHAAIGQVIGLAILAAIGIVIGVVIEVVGERGSYSSAHQTLTMQEGRWLKVVRPLLHCRSASLSKPIPHSGLLVPGALL